MHVRFGRLTMIATVVTRCLQGRVRTAGSARWQYRIGGDAQLSEARRVSDRSLQALFYRRDPLDYCGERGVTLIRHLPFTLSVLGAAFGVGFSYHTPVHGDSAFRTTRIPYTEAGFALGNLLPFLAPLNVGAQFTWQLPRQATRRFQFGLDLRGP